MSDFSGKTVQVEWKGETLTVSVARHDVKVQGLFQRWGELRLFEGLARNQTNATEPVFRVCAREAIREIFLGTMAWGGPLADESTWTIDGAKELTFLCLYSNNPKWTRQNHEQLCADPVKFDEVLRAVRGLALDRPATPKA